MTSPVMQRSSSQTQLLQYGKGSNKDVENKSNNFQSIRGSAYFKTVEHEDKQNITVTAKLTQFERLPAINERPIEETMLNQISSNITSMIAYTNNSNEGTPIVSTQIMLNELISAFFRECLLNRGNFCEGRIIINCVNSFIKLYPIPAKLDFELLQRQLNDILAKLKENFGKEILPSLKLNQTRYLLEELDEYKQEYINILVERVLDRIIYAAKSNKRNIDIYIITGVILRFLKDNLTNQENKKIEAIFQRNWNIYDSTQRGTSLFRQVTENVYLAITNLASAPRLVPCQILLYGANGKPSKLTLNVPQPIAIIFKELASPRVILNLVLSNADLENSLESYILLSKITTKIIQFKKSINTEIINTDNVDTDNVNTDNVNTDNVNTDNVNTDNVNTDNVNTDNVNTDNVNTVDSKIKKIIISYDGEENFDLYSNKGNRVQRFLYGFEDFFKQSYLSLTLKELANYAVEIEDLLKINYVNHS